MLLPEHYDKFRLELENYQYTHSISQRIMLNCLQRGFPFTGGMMWKSWEPKSKDGLAFWSWEGDAKLAPFVFWAAHDVFNVKSWTIECDKHPRIPFLYMGFTYVGGRPRESWDLSYAEKQYREKKRREAIYWQEDQFDNFSLRIRCKTCSEYGVYATVVDSKIQLRCVECGKMEFQK